MSTKCLKMSDGGGKYIAPACDSLELTIEGVLCQSQEFGVNMTDPEGIDC